MLETRATAETRAGPGWRGRLGDCALFCMVQGDETGHLLVDGAVFVISFRMTAEFILLQVRVRARLPSCTIHTGSLQGTHSSACSGHTVSRFPDAPCRRP